MFLRTIFLNLPCRKVMIYFCQIRLFQARAPRGACEWTWKYKSISSCVQPSRSARNQGHDKRGEIYVSLISCGSSIHHGHKRSVMILEEDKKLLSVWLLYYLKTFSFYIFFFYIPIRQSRLNIAHLILKF